MCELYLLSYHPNRAKPVLRCHSAYWDVEKRIKKEELWRIVRRGIYVVP
jgi:hypothetical protein